MSHELLDRYGRARGTGIWVELEYRSLVTIVLSCTQYNSPFELYNSAIGERDLKSPDDADNSDEGSESNEILVATDNVGNSGLLDLVNFPPGLLGVSQK